MRYIQFSQLLEIYLFLPISRDSSVISFPVSSCWRHSAKSGALFEFLLNRVDTPIFVSMNLEKLLKNDSAVLEQATRTEPAIR